MSEPDDTTVGRATAQYAPADITPGEFETFVAELLKAAGPAVDRLNVTLHESVTGVDGTYDFDATVRFELAGMAFLVLVEANGTGIPSNGNSSRYSTRRSRALEPTRAQ